MSYIFFGWLLVFLYFTINGFDVLPDFIGYILIFAGVNKLSEKSSYFSEARIFALIMSMVSFGNLPYLEAIINESEVFMILFVIMRVFLTVIPLYMMYLIIKGVADLEWEMATCLGVNTLMQVWKINVIVTFLLFIATVLLEGIFHVESEELVLMTALTICVLIVNIAWVICFYSCKKRYDAIVQHEGLSFQKEV